MNFSLPQLEAFVTTAETGSFKAAAVKLNKRSQAVSKLVAALEDSCNVVLFERTAKSLKITDEGARVLGSAKRILSDSIKLESLFKSIDSGLSRKLVIGIDNYLQSREVNACCRAVAEEYPSTDIQIIIGTTKEVTDWVEQGKVDIGLRISTLKQVENAIIVTVFSFDLLNIAPASVFRVGEVISEEQLQPLPQLVYETVYDISLDKPHIISDKVVITNNLTQVIGLVEQGMGWSLVPDLSVNLWTSTDQVVEVSIEGGSRYQWNAECIYQDEDQLSMAADFFLQKVMEIGR
ncbi:LysR family transcriptional regulator [Paraferrimonas sedimenticola]|uniref:LysR family transcriptional regulator n=1 Tax=Paraferrimonas sedimenticola TaxID=375674 RepID=A0AA37RZH5_9GAMM|nr:LysR family transcriptional regulator [Paraferrimonas sedimenticola]GLP98041.1 LysR family transcriptional regulator [Paraferrimonas sedimenticola]